MTTLTDTPIDLEALKQRQQATWASGDFAEIATLIVPVAERLCDAADLRAGSHVLDVATGSGNAAIAAARLGCRVIGIDYVPALLERGRERAAAERLSIDFVHGDAEAIPFADASFDAVALGVRVDVRPRPPSHRRGARSASAGPAGRSRSRAGRPRGSSATCSGRWATTCRRPPASCRRCSGARSSTSSGCSATTSRGRTAGGRSPSASRPRTAFVETFVRFYGPTLKAVEAAGPALVEDLLALVHGWNRLPDDGPVAVPGAYLESVGTRV